MVMKRVSQTIPHGNFVLLNHPNEKGEKCIYLRFHINKKYLKRSTSIWILPELWDDKHQVVKDEHPSAARLNNKLNLIYEEIRSALLDFKGNINYENLSVLIQPMRHTKLLGADSNNIGQDLIAYAHKVNDIFYKSQKYGYTAWYNKSKYIDAFDRFVSNYLKRPKPTLSNVTISIFDEYIKYRFEVLNNKSKEAINKTLVPIYAALDYAVNNQEAELKTVAQITSHYLITRSTKYSDAKERVETIRYLTPKQIMNLAEYCENIKSRNAREIMDMFFFSYHACGMRLSDIITLEWKHIDFNSMTINKVQVKTKRSPEVEIPISPAALEILLRWKSYRYNNRFVFNRLPEDFDMTNERQLFMARNAKDKGVNRVLATIGRNSKMPIKLTMHVARHSFAVMCINKGLSLHMVSKLLGHASTVATEKTYAEFLKDKVKEDVRNLYEV